MNPTKRAFLELHFAVVLFGFTAILGGLIQLSAIVLVWWRIFFTCLAFLVYGDILTKLKQLPPQLKKQFLSIGLIIAVHWLAFFGSVKLANASVALVSFATTSFQSAILEPIMTRQSVKWYEVALGLIVIPAMMLIAGSLPDNMLLGLIVGIFSAFLAVVFSILNKKKIHTADPVIITFLEMSGGWLLLTAVLPVFFYFNKGAAFWPVKSDWVYLLILAILCTNLGYWIALKTLKHISAFASNLTINLEPIYGIILAWLILKEDKQLTSSFYLGAAMILSAVLSYPLLRKRFDKSTPSVV